MDHVAIMNPKWRLIEKILSGEKTIESRWYVNKVTPWDRISAGETVYFKDAGKQVTAKAVVSKIIQEEIISLEQAQELVKKHQKGLCFTDQSLTDFSWLVGKRYVILIFLERAEKLEQPFAINKKGFGSAAAWLTVQDINKLINQEDKVIS